ncbi:hypothetical protein CDD81_3131 [Ophiocordyceps australis]|uniref:Fringe-like glycosyltransferase domain-containing protein n=1 Tax=Ophiocordyceps australis TaxID=1399860 RepID=A0A2C5XVP8_9HYPO|nr:hypothetical protein CDD81_3131 [Ophiocordyceps australis]
MGVILFRPKRAMALTMRISLARVVIGALCMLLIIMALMRTDRGPVRNRIFTKIGIKASTPVHQRPSSMDDANADHTQAPIIVGGANFDLHCSTDASHLTEVKDRYSLDDKFQYMRRYVRFHRTAGLERKRMSKLPQKFLDGSDSFKTIDLARPQALDTSCAAPLEVQVPDSGLPSTVNASDFMFSVSTTYQRLMDSSTAAINEWVFWLTDGRGHSNGGKLLLMLLNAGDDELQEVANMLGDVGVDVDVYHSDSTVEMAVRYLTLVPTLYTHSESNTKKWLVLCDDDTFFPNMHLLIEKFRTFDHTRDMYIGTLSEDIGAVERHGSQAFGGGGVFLSRPLAEKITDKYSSCSSNQKVLESNSGWGPQGDILLRKCIYENTETRLTALWDLWQLDINGDPSGFYEWGIQPLSLHHYRGGGWHKAKPAQYAKIAHICGEACILQRFQTNDDYIISGYSVAHYPEGINFDTNQVEGTLYAPPENKGWNLDYMLGPQRQSLEKTGRKIAWEMQESEILSDGSVLQTFTRKKDDGRWTKKDGQAMSNIDGVIELVWIPSQ